MSITFVGFSHDRVLMISGRLAAWPACCRSNSAVLKAITIRPTASIVFSAIWIWSAVRSLSAASGASASSSTPTARLNALGARSSAPASFSPSFGSGVIGVVVVRSFKLGSLVIKGTQILQVAQRSVTVEGGDVWTVDQRSVTDLDGSQASDMGLGSRKAEQSFNVALPHVEHAGCRVDR